MAWQPPVACVSVDMQIILHMAAVVNPDVQRCLHIFAEESAGKRREGSLSLNAPTCYGDTVACRLVVEFSLPGSVREQEQRPFVDDNGSTDENLTPPPRL